MAIQDYSEHDSSNMRLNNVSVLLGSEYDPTLSHPSAHIQSSGILTRHEEDQIDALMAWNLVTFRQPTPL